ncbi:ORF20A [turkey adenovirus 5]|uniref:ORF20A n=1 Tax=turkey adenovirus 5 TaxID=1408258 RepID=U5NHM9_9ADEN|nr:ORF20A [Turkey aviadenovirus 5]AGX93351.1 ORF20A [Turkey aviadenovirus 5]
MALCPVSRSTSLHPVGVSDATGACVRGETLLLIYFGFLQCIRRLWREFLAFVVAAAYSGIIVCSYLFLQDYLSSLTFVISVFVCGTVLVYTALGSLLYGLYRVERELSGLSRAERQPSVLRRLTRWPWSRTNRWTVSSNPWYAELSSLRGPTPITVSAPPPSPNSSAGEDDHPYASIPD